MITIWNALCALVLASVAESHAQADSAPTDQHAVWHQDLAIFGWEGMA